MGAKDDPNIPYQLIVLFVFVFVLMIVVYLA